MASSTATGGERHTGEQSLSKGEIFNILGNRRRRFVIHALKRAEEPLDVSELSKYVTAWELNVNPEEVVYEDRRNVYSTLQRTHLPKLEEKAVVTVDEDNHVEPAPALDELDIYIEALRSREIPWSTYYLGLAGVAVALSVAVLTNVPVFGALAPLDAAIFVATTFGISAAVHRVVGRRARLGNTEKPPEVRKIE